MKAMLGRGGENPWEVGYDENLAKAQDAVESSDNAVKESEQKLDDLFGSRVRSSKF